MAKRTKKPENIKNIQSWQKKNYSRADLVKDLNTLKQFFADVRESDGEGITLKDLRECEAAIERIMLIHNVAYKIMDTCHHPSVWSDLVDLESDSPEVPYIPWFVEREGRNGDF